MAFFKLVDVHERLSKFTRNLVDIGNYSALGPILFIVLLLLIAITRLLNVCRLILTAVLLTAKMYNDTYYTNQYVASVGGVSLQNINELERFFMLMIDWRLYITTEEFDHYERSLF